MAKKLTQERVIEQFREKHGDMYIYDRVEYVNEKTKVWIGCRVEGHGYFEQTPNGHKQGTRCPLCFGTPRLSIDDVILQFKNMHGDKYVYDKVEYINDSTKVLIGCKVDDHGYFSQSPNDHKFGKGCPKCGRNFKLTLEEISKLYNNEHREILSIETIKVGKRQHNMTYIKYKCLVEKCGYIGGVTLSGIKRGASCPSCSGHVVTETNCVASVRPDLIKYFQNKEDVYTVTAGSSKKIQTVCPSCNLSKSKLIEVSTLSYYGFSCEHCSDGISIPEKFGINLLKQLNVDFETQKIFEWTEDKRYDFYILSLNIIIESHGMGHYRDSFGNMSGRSLKEEQENDKLKYDLAIQNGIKPNNYITIDCRYSKFEWLKNNYTNSLSNYFDLSNVDWIKVWDDCQNTVVSEVWDIWNNRSEHCTTSTVADIFGLKPSTIREYLKRGNEIGKCNYDPIDERIKASKKTGKNGKIVYQYTLEGAYIDVFKSCSEIGMILSIHPSNISANCTGIYKQSGGFKWSYNPPNEHNMYPD